MLFVTGLLTLLALSNAGGDHTKGGDHHIKGGDRIASGTKTVQQTQVVEGIVPSPYSFNIKTGAAYGASVSREEVGDADGTVKGFYALSSPRGSTRVVEYVADQTGFHANVKTSEPNIKTHSPANAQIESVPKTVVPVAQAPVIPAPVQGGVKSLNVLGASVPVIRNAQIREPIARPVQSFAAYGHGKVNELGIIPIRRGIGNIEPVPAIRTPVQLLRPDPVPLFDAPVLHAGGPLTGGAREVIVLEDGTIVDVGDASRHTGQDFTIPFGVNSAVYSDTSRVVRKPAVSPVRTSYAAPKPKPLALSQTLPKQHSNDEIKELNRQLILKQEQSGFAQTFGGVVNSDSGIDKISLSKDQLDNIRKGIRYGTNRDITRVQLRKPDSVVRSPPNAVRQNIRTNQPATPVIRKDEKFKFTAPAIHSGNALRLTPANRRQPGAVPVRTSANQGDNTFIWGNTGTLFGTRYSGGAIVKPSLPKPKAISPVISVQKPVVQVVQKAGINDEIITLNRQLIQSQNQNDFKQIFGGVVPADGDIGRISFSSDQLGDISKQFNYGAIKPVAQVVGARRPVEVSKPSVVRQRIPTIVRPNAVSVSNRDQIQTYVPQKPVQVIQVPSGAPETNLKAEFTDGIVDLNRKLIQKQSEGDFKQIFGNVANSDSGIDGISFSLEDLDDITRKVGYEGNQRYTPVEIKADEVIRLNPGTVRQIAPVSENRREFVLGNSAGAQPRLTPISSPKPIPQSQIQSSGDIVAINRQLIQKQNEEGFRQTFGSIAKNEDDLSGISISSDELSSISDLAKHDVVQEIKPAPRPVKPIQVAPIEKPKMPSVYGTRLHSRTQYPVVGSLAGQHRPTSNSAFAIRNQENSGVVVSRTQSGVQGSVTRTSTGSLSPQRNTVGIQSQGIQSIPQRSPVRVRSQSVAQVTRPQISVQHEAKKELGGDIIAFNRNLIEKQNNEGLLHAFGGIIKSDSDVDGITISEEELGDLSKIVGYGISGSQEGPSIQRTSTNIGGSRQASIPNYATNLRRPATINSPSRNQLQEIVDQDGIESPVVLQETFESSFPPQEQVSIGSANIDNQQQVKIDGIADQVPQQAHFLDIPVQTFLEEVPVEGPIYSPAPSYIPPLNYRAPPVRNSVKHDQQKLEQILV